MAKKPKDTPPSEATPKPEAVPEKLNSDAFAALAGLRAALPKADKEPPKPPPPPPRKPAEGSWRPDLDAELFRAAMSGVSRLGERSVPRVPPKAQEHAEDSAGFRRAQAQGHHAIPVKWGEQGRCEAARPGRLFALEALGRFASIDETLDLHRIDPAEVNHRVVEFVRTRRLRGARVVSVIHGQGRHAPDGQSVLRDAVIEALCDGPGANEVDAFCTAPPEHGGAGATLVALRTTTPGSPGRSR